MKALKDGNSFPGGPGGDMQRESVIEDLVYKLTCSLESLQKQRGNRQAQTRELLRPGGQSD